MKIATQLRIVCQEAHKEQRLFKVYPAVEYGDAGELTEFVLSSAVVDKPLFLFGESFVTETMLFPADRQGVVLEWSEVGRLESEANHQKLLEQVGYIVIGMETAKSGDSSTAYLEGWKAGEAVGYRNGELAGQAQSRALSYPTNLGIAIRARDESPEAIEVAQAVADYINDHEGQVKQALKNYLQAKRAIEELLTKKGGV